MAQMYAFVKYPKNFQNFIWFLNIFLTAVGHLHLIDFTQLTGKFYMGKETNQDLGKYLRRSRDKILFQI